MKRPRIVIVGGGFGGLAAARALARANVEVVLIDRRNFHLFQPLLYQVATGELSPANIASPLRAELRRQRNVQVLLGEVTGFDPQQHRVLLADGEITYDRLIVAAGATHSYFGRNEWEMHAPGLKTVEDATRIRRRILLAFERAERETDPAVRAAWLTFVIVGAGPTGIELAGALSEVAHHTLRRDFRSISTDAARILLVEAGPRPLGVYPEVLSERARRDLARLRVEVHTGCRITSIDDQQIKMESSAGEQTVPARTVIWAAGVAANPLGKALAEATQAKTDRVGRIEVQPDCSVAGHPEIFVIGDLASYRTEDGKTLPGVAPAAMQQGKYVARKLIAEITGKPGPKPFRYQDLGMMAVIGRYSAVAAIAGWKLQGITAWAIWLTIHLRAITQFRNRLLVLFQWAWTFLTRDRHARLITEAVDAPEMLADASRREELPRQ